MFVERVVPSVESERRDERSPRYFGSIDSFLKETLITSEPLCLSELEFRNLREITLRIVSFIDRFSLKENCIAIGANPNIVIRSLMIDSYGDSSMRYGGLDIYQDPNLGFKVLEINPRVQALGLQDFRQKELGIVNQPNLFSDLLSWLKGRGFEEILVLGSRKNPFWRAYEELTLNLNREGFNAHFWDAQKFLIENKMSGYNPDLILKFCSNKIFLDSDYSEELTTIVAKYSIPIINPLHSSYFGYRGFLEKLREFMPDIVPGQKILKCDASDQKLLEFPWVKLEASGYEYVVNYRGLKRWGKEALLGLIRGDILFSKTVLRDRSGSDASKLREVAYVLENVPPEEIVWLAQSNVRPLTRELRTKEGLVKMDILHRVYWFKDDEGNVNISLEAFGCTDSQLKQSKGKINAGTGYAIPVVIG